MEVDTEEERNDNKSDTMDVDSTPKWKTQGPQLFQLLRKRAKGTRHKGEAELRLEKDLDELKEIRKSGKKLSFRLFFPSGEKQILNFVCIFNLKEGPYAGCRLEFNVSVPDKYPYSPPTFHCKQKVFHPNIDPDRGRTLTPLLEKEWKPVVTMEHILLAVEVIFLNPHTEDEDCLLNKVAAELYLKRRNDYIEIVRRTILGTYMYNVHWTKVFINEAKRRASQMELSNSSPSAKRCKLAEAFQSLQVSPKSSPTISPSTSVLNTSSINLSLPTSIPESYSRKRTWCADSNVRPQKRRMFKKMEIGMALPGFTNPFSTIATNPWNSSATMFDDDEL